MIDKQTVVCFQRAGVFYFLVTFYDLLDSLRDVATWSLLERLQGFPKGQLTNDLQGQMHKLMQDLMYFRNVDGSFGEPMTQQTFK